MQCKYCGKAFASHAAHDSHVRRTHARDKPVTCHICGKSFGQSYDLKFHLKLHQGEWHTNDILFIFFERKIGNIISYYYDRLLLRPWLILSSGVAGVADDRISPCCPVCCVVLFQPHLCQILSLFQASFYLWFCRPLLLFPGMSTSNILLTMCSSFILLTWPYHFSSFSVIVLDTCATLVVPLVCSFPILCFLATPHIHISTLISFTYSCAIWCEYRLLRSVHCKWPEWLRVYYRHVWLLKTFVLSFHLNCWVNKNHAWCLMSVL